MEQAADEHKLMGVAYMFDGNADSLDVTDLSKSPAVTIVGGQQTVVIKETDQYRARRDAGHGGVPSSVTALNLSPGIISCHTPAMGPTEADLRKEIARLSQLLDEGERAIMWQIDKVKRDPAARVQASLLTIIDAVNEQREQLEKLQALVEDQDSSNRSISRA
jgi:hypothetical protein